jgi:hypothetical protein
VSRAAVEVLRREDDALSAPSAMMDHVAPVTDTLQPILGRDR